MTMLTHQLNFSPEAEPLPAGFSEQLYECSRRIADPSEARTLYAELKPLLSRYRADKSVAIACGLLLEKQRLDKGMRDVWRELQALYPKDTTSLRMLMRWYRREGRTDAGIAHLKEMFPRAWHCPNQATQTLLGMSELKAWPEIDRIMETILFLHPEDRSIRMAYIKALNEQCRYIDAAQVAESVTDREKMGRASQELLDFVEHNAETLTRYGRENTASVIDDIIDLAAPPRTIENVEKIVFFSGQLGTGGAERQMTRISRAFQDMHDGGAIGAPLPEVWVKHANVSTGGDFYRPELEKAGVRTRVLTEEPEIDVLDSRDLTAAQKELVSLLAADVQRHTCQLVKMFRENRTDVAYLWQDGGIVQSAIAAVLAGVPRIVTSFRGLPPNLRPNFYRDELPVLYGKLAKLPHVTFTANSRKTAQAYEDWLSLPSGTVKVIPNATPALSAEGEDTDHDFWDDVVSASPGCTKTVIGVFRMDANKRPIQWIEAAARHLEANKETRFIILGTGALRADCEALIEEMCLSDRVFLAGVRANVGFYMHRADVLMHLAEMEGLPNVLIEAQIAGTPVVATPAGGTDEVVTDGETGVLLSEAGSIPEAELDTTLTRILSDEEELARLGAAAMWHSRERFSIETVCETTLNLFNEVGEVPS